MTDAPLDRRRAAALAGHVGDVEGARLATADPDATVRAAALAALARLGVLTAGDLQVGAQDPHATVRRRTTELIGRRGPRPAALDGLDLTVAELLVDRAAAVVEMAAWAAGERWGLDDEGEPTGAPVEVLDRLEALARDADDALVREAAVAALGAIGDPTSEEAVVAAMTGPALLRRRAVLALAAFDGAAAQEALEAALGDRDWQVRQAAEDLLDARPAPEL